MSTTIQAENIVNLNLLTVPSPRNYNTDKLAMNLNRLNKKSARSSSQKGFLSKCIKETCPSSSLPLQFISIMTYSSLTKQNKLIRP